MNARGRSPVARERKAAAALAVLAAAVLAAAAGCAGPGAPRAAGTARHVAVTRGTAANGKAANGKAATAASCDPDASSLAPDGPPSVTAGSFAATIRARGYLIAGVDQSTYHFGFLNPLDNQIEGFDIDMVQAVAQAIFGSAYNPSRVHYKVIPDAERIPDILDGSVDIVAHTMTITCQRLEQIDFSSVYYDAQEKLLVLKNATAKDLADLAGQKVCATDGSDDVTTIERYRAIPVKVPYWTDCLVDLQQGQVAGISTDDSILHGLAAQDPFTKIVGPSLEPEPYGLGISKKHPDFVRFVNAVLERLRTDGQWRADYAKWVGTPVQNPPPPQYAN
jgi:polar amino acid transport system substrate-binding protein